MPDILVATDLSERSDRAVERAFRLANMLDVTCHVLSVTDDELPADLRDGLRANSLARLRRFVAACQPQPRKVAIDVVLGDPLAVIPQRADELDAALVVLGLHRPRLFLDLLRDTTMERLIRLSRRPVLLVRDPPDHDYQRVLAPVSFSPACAAALKAGRWLAPKAKIHPVHAIHLPFAGLTGEGPGGAMAREIEREAAAARDIWAQVNDLPDDLAKTTMTAASLFQLVEAEMRRFRPDLIAMGAHARTGLAPYTLGSFAAHLIRNPPTDLLIVRPAIGRPKRPY